MSKRVREEPQYNEQVNAAVGGVKRHSPTNDNFEAASEQMRIQFEQQVRLREQAQLAAEQAAAQARNERAAREQVEAQARANEQLADATNERLIRELQNVQRRLNLSEDNNRRMVNRIAELQRQHAAELGAAREAREMAEMQLRQAMQMLQSHGIMPPSHLNMLYKTDNTSYKSDIKW
jgi:hypothetical protein